MSKFKIFILLVLAGAIMNGYEGKENNIYESNHYIDGKFVNTENKYKIEYSKIMPILWDFIANKSKDATPKDGEIPLKELSQKNIDNLDDNSVIRLGHSTMLFKLGGEYYISDPVFSDRASLFSFMGPKRFHKSPITIEELPKLKGVIITHNHYDHLDKESIEKLKDKAEKFFTPLGVGANLVEYGVDRAKILEFDWWEAYKDEELELVCTPAQHFSGRGLFDNGDTLWSSWVIKTEDVNIFLGGDSGYFSGFKQIGEKYGPFDMTFLEAGAYNERWKEVHMMPKEVVQAHIDLKGKVLFPVHNGTFDLALHSWYEPLERVYNNAKELDVNITTPIMGEAITLLKKQETEAWWRK